MVELVHIDWFTWEPKSVIFYCFFHQVSALAVELTLNNQAIQKVHHRVA